MTDEEIENSTIKFIKNRSNTRMAIAKEYFQLILHDALYSKNLNIKKINAVILERYSPSGLLFIKEKAWKMFDEVGKQN